MAMQYRQSWAANHASIRGVRRLARPWMGFVGGLCWFSSQVHAAGGHHAVDDAAILAPGQCEVEVWADRERHGARALGHVGPACRLGPVEIGLNLDRTHTTGAGSTTFGGPQVKWAHAVTDSLSIGALYGTSWRDRTPGTRSSLLLFPVSWQARDTIAVHLNVGKDFQRGGGAPDTPRSGAAVEWAASSTWSFVGERFRESETNLWRIGARYAVNETTTLDLSQARGLQGSVPPWWTLGVTWSFAR